MTPWIKLPKRAISAAKGGEVARGNCTAPGRVRLGVASSRLRLQSSPTLKHCAAGAELKGEKSGGCSATEFPGKGDTQGRQRLGKRKPSPSPLHSSFVGRLLGAGSHSAPLRAGRVKRAAYRPGPDCICKRAGASQSLQLAWYKPAGWLLATLCLSLGGAAGEGGVTLRFEGLMRPFVLLTQHLQARPQTCSEPISQLSLENLPCTRTVIPASRELVCSVQGAVCFPRCDDTSLHL